MSARKTKTLLYEQVARIGKAVSSPKRLELLEILAQGEKTVELLASEAAIDLKLASAHLKVLKEARLVESRREGRFIVYRLSGQDVSDPWVHLRAVAEEHLIELRTALAHLFAAPEQLNAETRAGLLDRARQGDVLVLDVRPKRSSVRAISPTPARCHLPNWSVASPNSPPTGRSSPTAAAPFCMMSTEAVRLLKERGYRASKMSDRLPEWLAARMPVESGEYRLCLCQ